MVFLNKGKFDHRKELNTLWQTEKLLIMFFTVGYFNFQVIEIL